MTPAEYAKEWTKTASDLAAIEAYRWMAEQLSVTGAVLEVGCGSGEGTVRLIESGCSVVSIDINSDLISAAEMRIRSAGREVEVLPSDASSIRFGRKAQLLLGDIFGEQVAHAFAQSSVDAIVCWLIGASPDVIGQTLGASYESFEGHEMAAYRERIHRQCYLLGESCLKPGGLVHIVDRMFMQSWAYKDELRRRVAETHQAWAGPKYSVTKANAFFWRLPHLGNSNIWYVLTPGPDEPKLVTLCSVRAIRS